MYMTVKTRYITSLLNWRNKCITKNVIVNCHVIYSYVNGLLSSSSDVVKSTGHATSYYTYYTVSSNDKNNSQ